MSKRMTAQDYIDRMEQARSIAKEIDQLILDSDGVSSPEERKALKRARFEVGAVAYAWETVSEQK